MREPRLLHRTLDQLNQQRKQAGVTTPVVQQNARSIDQANNQQFQQERNAVLGNAAQGYGSSLNQETGQVTAVRNDPRVASTIPPQGANVGDARFDTMAARSAARGAARMAGDAAAQPSNLDRANQQIAARGDLPLEVATQLRQEAIQKDALEQQQQQQESQKATQRAAGTGVAGEKATESNGKATQDDPNVPQATPEQAAQMSALEAAGAQLGPEMQPLVQALQQTLMVNQQGMQDLQQGFAAQGQMFQEQRNDLKTTIDTLTNQAITTSKALESANEQMKALSERTISEQEAAAKARLDWNEQSQIRQLNDQKRQAIDSKIAEMAIRGRFGSDGGLAEINATGKSYEQAISDMQIEFGVQRTELAAKFTSLHTEAMNAYYTNSINNIKDLNGSLERISMQGLSSRQAIATAENNALQTFITNQVNLRKDAAKELSAGIKDIYGLIQTERSFKAQQETQKKTTAYNFFNWAFTNSDDPAMRRMAVKMMTDAGYEVPSDLSLEAWTIDDQLAWMDNVKSTEQASVYDIGQFTKPEDQMVYTQALNAITGLTGVTDGVREGHLNNVSRLLKAGDRKGAEEAVRSIAALKLKGEAPEFSSRSLFVSEAEQLIGTLETSSQTRNMYTGKWQDFMKYLAQNQNEDYLNLTAWMGNLTAETIKERYGSAFTDTERTEMERSIPSGKETVRDALVKWRQLVRSAKGKNDAMINTLLGQTSYTPSASTQEQTYDSDWVMRTMRGEAADGQGGGTMALPQVNGSLRSGFLNGIVTGYGSKYWEAGVDVAAPKGAPIKTPVPAVVENVVYKPSWVGHPNNKKLGMQQNGGFGNQVTLRYPDGVRLQVSHASKLPFGRDMVGKPVPPGSTIAYVGNTGNTYGRTGVHADITGFRPDGSMMTAKEVTAWMLKHSNPVS